VGANTNPHNVVYSPCPYQLVIVQPALWGRLHEIHSWATHFHGLLSRILETKKQTGTRMNVLRRRLGRRRSPGDGHFLVQFRLVGHFWNIIVPVHNVSHVEDLLCEEFANFFSTQLALCRENQYIAILRVSIALRCSCQVNVSTHGNSVPTLVLGCRVCGERSNVYASSWSKPQLSGTPAPKSDQRFDTKWLDKISAKNFVQHLRIEPLIRFCEVGPRAASRVYRFVPSMAEVPRKKIEIVINYRRYYRFIIILDASRTVGKDCLALMLQSATGIVVQMSHYTYFEILIYSSTDRKGVHQVTTIGSRKLRKRPNISRDGIRAIYCCAQTGCILAFSTVTRSLQILSVSLEEAGRRERMRAIFTFTLSQQSTE
ncbi:unnamed protein product, partial [Nesidiocoris tenuis]